MYNIIVKNKSSTSGIKISTEKLFPPIVNALPLSAHLCFALYSASRAITRRYQPVLRELGLSYPQYIVLLCLWEHQPAPMTLGSIARQLDLDSGTLTPLLKRMQTAGWLTRTRGDADEREVFIALTTAGAALQSHAAAIPNCLLEASNCTVDALSELNLQVRALRDRVNAKLE